MSEKYVVLLGIEGKFRKSLYHSLVDPKLRLRTDRYIGIVNNVPMAEVRDTRRRLVAGGVIPDQPLLLLQPKHTANELCRTKARQRTPRNSPAFPRQTAAALMRSCSMDSVREDMSVCEQHSANARMGMGRDVPGSGTTR